MNRLPVLKDCFKVKKGLCVTGDAAITGTLTLSGDFAWDNPGSAMVINSLAVDALSANTIHSNNKEVVTVDNGPEYGTTEYTITHPISVVDETIFEDSVSIAHDLSSNRYVNFPGLSSGFLSGGVVTVQPDGELTTSTVNVSTIDDVITVVSNQSADWNDDTPDERIHVMTRSSVNITTPVIGTTNAKEFLPMGEDNRAGDAVWDDITYAHTMVLPYDTTVKRVIVRSAGSQGARVWIGVHTNQGITDTNTIEYKYFPETPVEVANQLYTNNNNARVFTFTDQASATTGRTLGISISATQPINETNVSVVLAYKIPTV